MNHDDRSDRDVCQRRRRRGAYAAVLSAAAGAALAAAMIPAAPAFADPADDAVGAAGICVVNCPPLPTPFDDAVLVDSDGKVGPELAINGAVTEYGFAPSPIPASSEDVVAADASPSVTAAEETFLLAHPADLSSVVSFDLDQAYLGTGILAFLDAGAFDLDQIFPALTF